MNKVMYRSILAVLAAVVASSATAKDFKLATLKHIDNPNFDMTVGQCEPFYDYVKSKVAPAMEVAPLASSKTNVTKLKNGEGVSVKMGQKNYNVHINFPSRKNSNSTKTEMGGRSFGWTSGQVGDWSDAMYLNSLAGVMDSGDKTEIKAFYDVIINMLGCSAPAQLESLEKDSQRVATNFLAIYTAEAYRRIQNPRTRWDDALMQITLLGAFHGGQTNFEMFYTGKWTGTTLEKGPGVYANGRPGVLAGDANDKDAEMEDYHQFSFKTPDQQGSNRSGINLTRADFQRLGTAITAYERKAGNANLTKIEKIVGESTNVIAKIAAFYAEGKATVDSEKTDALAKAVAAFMINTFDDANDISASLRKVKVAKK